MQYDTKFNWIIHAYRTIWIYVDLPSTSIFSVGCSIKFAHHVLDCWFYSNLYWLNFFAGSWIYPLYAICIYMLKLNLRAAMFILNQFHVLQYVAYSSHTSMRIMLQIFTCNFIRSSKISKSKEGCTLKTCMNR